MNYLKKIILQPSFKFFSDKDSEKETIFLASSARSGSTWLQNTLTASNDFRVMFEPFNFPKTRALKGLPYKPYLHKETEDPVFQGVVSKILRGRYRNKWIDRDNKVFFPNKRFIKAIRANFMLAWMKEKFPEAKVVFLLRNPFSVAKSRMRMGWVAEEFDIFLDNSELVERHLPDSVDFLRQIKDPFLMMIAFWAVENIIPLRELEPGKALVVAYEDLVQNPVEELQRVYEYMGTAIPEGLNDLVKQESRTTKPERNRNSVELDAELERKAVEILAHFGLDKIYSSPSHLPQLTHKDILSDFIL